MNMARKRVREAPELVREILALQRLPMDVLQGLHEELFGEPPRVRGQRALVARIAAELQRQSREETEEDAMSTRPRRWRGKAQGPERPEPRRKPGLPKVGTVLVRRWRETELRLHVLENGFELDGVLHRSLSEAARAATGSHWGGPLFWGLKSRIRTQTGGGR
jgi:hypothetical protein